MKVKVDTRNAGRTGASFRLVLADKEIPYGLSVSDLRRLIIEAHEALAAHERVGVQRER